MRHRAAVTESAARARHTTGTQDLSTPAPQGAWQHPNHTLVSYLTQVRTPAADRRMTAVGSWSLQRSACEVVAVARARPRETGPTAAAASRELRPQILFLGRQEPGASALTRIQRQLNCAAREASPMPGPQICWKFAQIGFKFSAHRPFLGEKRWYRIVTNRGGRECSDLFLRFPHATRIIVKLF